MEDLSSTKTRSLLTIEINIQRELLCRYSRSCQVCPFTFVHYHRSLTYEPQRTGSQDTLYSNAG